MQTVPFSKLPLPKRVSKLFLSEAFALLVSMAYRGRCTRLSLPSPVEQSLLARVRKTSAVVNEGPEKGVNGCDTVKYSIDTAHGTPTKQSLY